MTDNVTALRATDVPSRHDEEVEAFDSLFAEWLAASAEVMGREDPGLLPDQSNADMDRKCRRVLDLYWQLVRTPAPLPRHIELKFQALFAEIGEEGVSRGSRAMMESIRADVLQD